LATPAERAKHNYFNGLNWQTAVSAHIEAKSVSSPVANRSATLSPWSEASDPVDRATARQRVPAAKAYTQLNHPHKAGHRSVADDAFA
jgi:hypothetical protein